MFTCIENTCFEYSETYRELKCSQRLKKKRYWIFYKYVTYLLRYCGYGNILQAT